GFFHRDIQTNVLLHSAAPFRFADADRTDPRVRKKTSAAITPCEQGSKRLSESLFYRIRDGLRLQGLGDRGGQTLQSCLWIPFRRGP
ncbi:hypothetical protein, partial [Bradyrhizobium sp. AC87j1]|uniref:hypothetical protein n=1 Tax=Bradyrhizobium sp. AC87j1 TaxID=2055894 RepID=UPI001AECDB82